MSKITKRFSYFVILSCLITSLGCATAIPTIRFNINNPIPSSITYSERVEPEMNLSINDLRSEEDKPVSVGTINKAANVVLANMEDEILFLGENIERELRSRGITVAYSREEIEAGFQLNVKKYRIRNYRSSGFGTYWTYTTFSSDLLKDEESKRITFYFKIGKVPVWTFAPELEGPCYNIPLSLMIKEIASKINRFYFGLQVPTEKVEALVADIETSFEKYTFLKVLELGCTNNMAATWPLVRLADHQDVTIRFSAICSLGVLGAVEQFDFLKHCYQTREGTEKLMALKSIGDLDTPEAIEFIESVKDSPDYQNKEIQEIVDLYI